MILVINFLGINISDWIQIAIALITLFGILVSLYISVKTLKQNSEIMEDNTRPQIIIYKDTITIKNRIEYLVIKNIGNSLAHIESIYVDTTILKSIQYHGHSLENVFERLNNSYLAPQQFYRIPITSQISNINTIFFYIKYSSNFKSYSETYNVSLKQDESISDLKYRNSKDELEIISKSIQELINRITWQLCVPIVFLLLLKLVLFQNE